MIMLAIRIMNCMTNSKVAYDLFSTIATTSIPSIPEFSSSDAVISITTTCDPAFL